MNVSRWLSLSIAIIYILFFVFPLVLNRDSDEISNRDIAEGAFGLLFWLALSLGCIWFGEELGEGLVGARFGLVSFPSPGWAVQLMGWILLLLPAVIFLWNLVGAEK
jgi:hypothetical protein